MGGSADRKLLLEPDILQFAGLWVCFCLVGAAVGTGRVDDLDVPQDRSSCGMAPGSLSAVADLRGVSDGGSVDH